MEIRQIDHALPKLPLESSFYLKDILGSIGIPNSFTLEVEFSEMNRKQDLFTGDVLHKTFITSDEAVTEAATGTAVVMQVTSFPPTLVRMKVECLFSLIRVTKQVPYYF